MKDIRQFVKSKKGSFGDLKNAALGLGVFGMVIVLVALLISEVQGTTTANSLAYNISQTILGAIEDLADWTPIIVVAIIMVVILSLILRRLGYL